MADYLWELLKRNHPILGASIMIVGASTWAVARALWQHLNSPQPHPNCIVQEDRYEMLVQKIDDLHEDLRNSTARVDRVLERL